MTEQTEYIHDLFVSYASADRAWVEGYLLDALIRAGVRCHSEAAFALGVPRLLEFERAVRQSRRILLVLSPATLAEGFGQFTDLLAQSYGLETATWPVIPLILQPVELPPRLAMLTALDATDPGNWEAVVERLCAELQRPVPGPAPRPPCPYPGMVPFSEADRDRFFGRDEEVQELLERLRLHPFLTVIGPSGSGKSSLVFAGLVPALRRSSLFGTGDWLVRAMRPGDVPAVSLAIALKGDPSDPARVASGLLSTQPGAPQRLLLVVDQFEQCFTRARRYVDVEPFQQALLRIAETPDCYVVLIVRADFYPDLMAAPLWREIQAHRVEILPLDEDGLRQAIVRPAEDAGVFVEMTLVERLVADAGREPGVLPLLQETLVLLWERLERRFLPLSVYEAMSSAGRTGVQVAMAQRADAALADLMPAQQAIARRIFLRLVQFGEGRADTRRQQPVIALRVAGDEPPLFEQTLRHLTDNRLLTLSGEEGGNGRQVDIAHEALIAGWPTLQEWLTERREAEQTRRRLEGKAVEWVRLGRGTAGLLDEVELLESERWLASPDAADLGYGETLSALVEASRVTIEEEKREREAARQRELEQARVLAEEQRRRAEDQARTSRRLRWLAMALTVVLLLAVGAAVYAGTQQHRAERQARHARSRQLAAQAQSVLEEYPQRSLLLALEAVTTTMQVGEPRIPAAEQALRQALANAGGYPLHGHEGAIEAVAISPNGRWLATGSQDKTARLWDLTAPDVTAEPIVLRGHKNELAAVTFSPDGHWLATGSLDNTARLWDLTAPNPAADPIVLRGHQDWITTVSFSPDCCWLATGSLDGTARLWDLTALNPAADPIVLHGHEDIIWDIAISFDSHWLITGSADGTARLWDLTAPDPAADPVVFHGHEGVIRDIAVSTDDRWLVTGSLDGTARLWNLTAPDPAAAPIVLHGGPMNAVVVSPDCHWLVTGSLDGTARLWDLTVSNPAACPIILRGHEGEVRAVAFSPNGRWLATGSEDSITRLWDLTAIDPGAGSIILRGHEGGVRAVAFSPNGHWLVTGSRDNTARLWDLTVPNPAAAPLILRGHESWIKAVAVTPDNHWLVTGSVDGTAQLWDLTTPNPATAPIVLRGHEGAINTAAISLDSRWLITASGDGTARLWDLTASEPAVEPIVLRGHRNVIWDVAISPDNHWLVTGSMDDTARLWDLTAPDPAADPIVLRGHEDRVRDVVIGPDNHWLVTGSWDGTARLWDLTAPNPAVAPFVLCAGPISAVAISSDGRWLVTGNIIDGTARLWDLTALDPAADPIVLCGHEGPISAMAISSNSRWLATGSWDNTAQLWDLTTPDPAAESIVLRGHESWVRVVAFSPDGRWLATGSDDSTARLWDLTAFDPAADPIVLRGHEDAILDIAISPDSHWLATGSRDSTARLWNLRLDELVDLACRIAGRNLTRAEWNQYLPGQAYRKTCEQWPLEGD